MRAYHKRKKDYDACFLLLLVTCTDGERVKQQELMCIVQEMLVQRREGGYETGSRRGLIKENSRGGRQTDRTRGTENGS